MTYDEKQTYACTKLRERLQSIALLAVQAQELDPSGDPLTDLLGDISNDLMVAQWINEDLNADDVDRAVRTAERGRR